VRPDPSCFQADTSEATARAETLLDSLADTLADTLTSAHEATALPAPITFEHFARQIAAQEIEAAGRSLAVLFAVDITLGCRCATTFYTRYLESPDVVAKALRLRRELQAGGPQGPLTLLAECFGLHGAEAAGVVQTLSARLAGHNEAC
jgi:hypothetical protein